MQRVLIIGDSSSGKTTLGRALADALGVRFVELDALYWLPGWQGRPEEEFRALLQGSLPADEGWVAAGNYTSYRDAFWPRADTGIWLDFPLRITLPRLVGRSWRRYRSKEMLWGTNYDRFWPMFKLWDTRASLLSFTVEGHGRRRSMLEATMDRDPAWAHIDFVRLRRPREVRAWLERRHVALSAARDEAAAEAAFERPDSGA